jgi:hypothetical protein
MLRRDSAPSAMSLPSNCSTILAWHVRPSAYPVDELEVYGERNAPLKEEAEKSGA